MGTSAGVPGSGLWHGRRLLVVVSGLPGTGKSAVAAQLASRLAALHLSVDPIEDAMPGVVVHEVLDRLARPAH